MKGLQTKNTIAFALNCFNLKNLCYLYFFLSPFFLDRMDKFEKTAVFAIGYLISGSIVTLGIAERMSKFTGQVSFNLSSLLPLGMIAMCFFSLLINTPERLLWPSSYYYKYLKLILPVASFFIMINVWTWKDLSKLYSLVVAMSLVGFAFLIPEGLPYFLGSPYLPRFGIYFLDDPNKYALFLNVVYGMCFPLLISRIINGRAFGALLFGNFSVLLVLFLTQSRSGIFTCFSITVICLAASRSKRLILRSILFITPVAVLFSLAFLLRYQNAKSGAEVSDMGRLWTYAVAFNIISDRPFSGIGFANVTTVYHQYGGRYLFLLGRALGIHNSTLEIFAEEGFFGAVIYLLLVFVPVIILIKRILIHSRKYYPVIEIVALNIPIAFFCYGLFYINYLADDYFWAYMAFTFIVLRSQIPEGYDLRLIKPRWI